MDRLNRSPHRKRSCGIHLRGQNRLLNMLHEAGEERAIGSMDKVRLQAHAPLLGLNVPISHAYFPLCGVASLVLHLDNGTSTEVGTMGNEGMVGVPLVLSSDRSHTEAYVQIGGDFMRMPTAAFVFELGCNGRFAEVMRLYVQGFFAQVAQSTACLRHHAVEQRMCRWLLMAHDSVGTDTLRLTQEFLAMMLGVQRPTVSLAAAKLQNAGLIKYHRGVIVVLDRDGLESASCECYEVVRTEFERLLCDWIKPEETR